MTKISRSFTAGKMNKALIEKLIPNGEYIHAVNCKIDTSSVSGLGSIENVKGNTQLTTLKYTDGTPFSASAVCIGGIEDSKSETLYWFVHDPSSPSSPVTGKLDAIVSMNVPKNILKYHVISIDNGGGIDTTLNFDPQYRITGVNLIDDMLFFVRGNGQPMKINVKRSYGFPGLTDTVTEDELLVLKAPPRFSPGVELTNTGNSEGYLSERIVSFSYRYRYSDGEYSAPSQFSLPAFIPGQFDLSQDTFLNSGMKNLYNTAIISYSSGGSQVNMVELLMKEHGTNSIKVIAKIDKAASGLMDNESYTYVYDGSGIVSILPDSENLRLFDSVPVSAIAQTVMGNRIMYGNYKEGYEMVDDDGGAVNVNYEATLNAESIGYAQLTCSKDSGSYNLSGAPVTYDDCVALIDFSGVSVSKGSFIYITLEFAHESFAGGTSPSYTTPTQSIQFTVPVSKDYANAYDYANSDEFKESIGTVSNIQPIATAGNGSTLTDVFNARLSGLGVYSLNGSGINAVAEPIRIVSTIGSSVVGLQIPAVKYVASGPVNLYEFLNVVSISAAYQDISNPMSLHSNRSYEVGLVYMDRWGRSSDVFFSDNSSVSVPCENAGLSNSVRVTIPPDHKPPVWADRYKFVIKSDKGSYETIFSNFFVTDPVTGFIYFLVDGENAQKVSEGMRLIVKRDSRGVVTSFTDVTVIEKDVKAANFLKDEAGDDIISPSGAYIKLSGGGIFAQKEDKDIVAPGEISRISSYPGQSPIVAYPVNYYNESTGLWEALDIPVGTQIKLKFDFSRPGNNNCYKITYSYEAVFTSRATYANFQAWWEGDGIENFIDSGTKVVENGDIDNVYVGTISSAEYRDIGSDEFNNRYGFWVDPAAANSLYLVVSGTTTCGGLWHTEGDRATVAVNVEIIRNDSLFIFESEADDSIPGVYFESSEAFLVSNGNHMGNVSNQDIALDVSAVIDCDFFNCYSFGNGCESYKVLDSIVGKPLQMGSRVISPEFKEYGVSHRYADITYSGVYNNESNVNKLNEFNAGLLNYKSLENSFGPIWILDGRETDVLVLQEDKISYVLSGKNLLTDAVAGGTIASVPEVLGTQIARQELIGISSNPESYSKFGSSRYFTDTKRGLVVKMTGQSGNSDQIDIISEKGMGQWFKNELKTKSLNQKIGGYDPLSKEYVLNFGNTLQYVDDELAECGDIRTFSVAAGEPEVFYISLGKFVGAANIIYNVIKSTPSAVVNIYVDYNGVISSSLNVGSDGSVTYDKDEIEVTYCKVTVSVVGGTATVTTKSECPSQTEINIVMISLNSPEEANESISNEYNYSKSGVTYKAVKSFVLFRSGNDSMVVSEFKTLTGKMGDPSFPVQGSDVRMISRNKSGREFDINSDKMLYLRSNIQYSASDINTILNSATEIAVTDGVSYKYGEFSPSINIGEPHQYIYMIWDYRKVYSHDLSYHVNVAAEACCQDSTATEYFSSSSDFESCISLFTDENMVTLAPDGYYSNGPKYRYQENGLLGSVGTCPECDGILLSQLNLKTPLYGKNEFKVLLPTATYNTPGYVVIRMTTTSGPVKVYPTVLTQWKIGSTLAGLISEDESFFVGQESPCYPQGEFFMLLNGYRHYPSEVIETGITKVFLDYAHLGSTNPGEFFIVIPRPVPADLTEFNLVIENICSSNTVTIVSGVVGADPIP